MAKKELELGIKQRIMEWLGYKGNNKLKLLRELQDISKKVAPKSKKPKPKVSMFSYRYLNSFLGGGTQTRKRGASLAEEKMEEDAFVKTANTFFDAFQTSSKDDEDEDSLKSRSGSLSPVGRGRKRSVTGSSRSRSSSRSKKSEKSEKCDSHPRSRSQSLSPASRETETARVKKRAKDGREEKKLLQMEEAAIIMRKKKQ